MCDKVAAAVCGCPVDRGQCRRAEVADGWRAVWVMVRRSRVIADAYLLLFVRPLFLLPCFGFQPFAFLHVSLLDSLVPDVETFLGSDAPSSP